MLDKLVAAGHVAEVDAGADQRAGGFWELHSLDGDAALARVAATPIDVVRFGDVSDEGFAEAAEQAGLTLGSGPSALTVVLVDDYLNPGIADFNLDRLADGRPGCSPSPPAVCCGPDRCSNRAPRPAGGAWPRGCLRTRWC